MRIDSSGRVGIGTSSPSEKLELENTTNGAPVRIELVAKDTGGTSRSGQVFFDADTNTVGFRNGGSNALHADSSGNVLVGYTTSNIGNAGIALNADNSAYFARDGGAPVLINRNTNDGTLVNFRQDNTVEGSISVSGGTVSYNGGHLSRWSRLMDGADDSNIYKGTVMSNLNEMIAWGDEDNEQLNHTEVSSVEGDPNVAGVFVAWDESDEWGDYYLAMTGDMIIRIAAGVTVQRGDLLMSAGDGTAKPQGDDIVRSKTIAKVISNSVTHTYPDGSYAVPCVLMGC